MIARVALLAVLCAVAAGASPAGAAPARANVLRASRDFADPLVPSGVVALRRPYRHARPARAGRAGDPRRLRRQVRPSRVPGRPNLIALDNQEPAPIGGVHGTAVASVIGAPVNGVGLVGHLPAGDHPLLRRVARRRHAPAVADIANGILAAARAGRSVINLSLGGPGHDRLIDAAMTRRCSRAASSSPRRGTPGEEDNELSYPGANPHVLTVGATDDTDAAGILHDPFAVRRPRRARRRHPRRVGTRRRAGSPSRGRASRHRWSPAPPPGSGPFGPTLDASQVAEILRTSRARREHARLRRRDGLRDPRRAGGARSADAASRHRRAERRRADAATLTTRARTTGRTSGRVALFEDPRDVFRVWLPAKKRVTVSAASAPGATLALFATRSHR